MFDTGKLLFAAVVLVLFAVVLFFSYKADKKRSKAYFKNSYVVLIAFLIFMGFLIFLKVYFKGK